MKKRKMRANVLKNLVSILIIALHISPFYVMFIMSLKQRRDFSSRWLLPAKATLDNYALALKGGDLMRSVTNTAIIVLISTVMIIVIGAMASGDPILFEKGTEKVSIYNHEAGRIEPDETFEDFFAFVDGLYDLLEIGG